VSDALAGAGRPDLVGRLTLVVSELATNAVLHASTAFDVDVEVTRDDVVVGVTDAGGGVPVRHVVDVRARQGRGLAIVETLCTSWGVEPHRPGKRVWCRVVDDVSAPTDAAAATVGDDGEAAPRTAPGESA
jgi:anti-sigma regulatory factor (Ser/Thr protein kinase)